MRLHQKLFFLLILFLPVQLGLHFWPSWSYVYGLRVDYLSPTLYFTDLLLLLILFFWFLENLKTNQALIIKNWKLKIIIFLFLLLSSLLALNPFVSLFKLARIIELALFFLYLKHAQSSLFSIQLPLALATLFSSLLAIMQFIKQSSLNGIFWFLGERSFSSATPGIAQTIFQGQLSLRPYATFSHPNSLAAFLFLALILTLPFLYRRSKMLGIGYFILIFTALIFTFSRTILILALLTPLIYWLTKNKPKLFTYLTVLTVLVLTVLPFVHNLPNSESWFRRSQLSNVALSLITYSPLLGVGLNNYIPHLPNHWSLLENTYWFQPVHNIYLLIASETGLVGLLIFIVYIAKTFIHSLQIKNSILIISLLIILLSGAVDHYWLTLPQNQLLFTVIVGLIWQNRSFSKY